MSTPPPSPSPRTSPGRIDKIEAQERERERIANLIKEWNLHALEELKGIAEEMAQNREREEAKAAAAAAAAAADMMSAMEQQAVAATKQQLMEKIENLRKKLDFPVGYRPKTESNDLKKTLKDLQELERDRERKKQEPKFFKADLRL